MRISVNEDKTRPFDAKEVAARCPDCKKLCIIQFPYHPTPQQRIEMIKSVLDEHRKNCTAAPPEQRRVYEIWYPRKGW